MLQESDIRSLALQTGFDDCLTAPADRLDADAVFMDGWVDAGLAGEMTYLERNRELRYDIRQLVPGAQTVIVCLLTYGHSGRDYHRTVKSLLYTLEARLKEHIQSLSYMSHPMPPFSDSQHIFCDSAPVLERRWAVRAGLGFIGKNHQLIHPTLGSKVHPGELVMNIPCERDVPRRFSDMGCGGCAKCIDVCPGQALGREEWDARRCVAYVTHKCLVCQDICPYNKNR